MTEKPVQVLVVNGDEELAAMVSRCLEDTSWAEVTHVTTASDAICEELTTRHDVVVAAMSLPDGDGLSLTRELRVTNHCPVILTTEQPTAEEAVEALRLRITDVLIQPFDIADLIELIRVAAERRLRYRHRQRRYRRLRSLVSRIIRGRRDLRPRMDLICRDLVHAYRNLAQKVAQSGALTHDLKE